MRNQTFIIGCGKLGASIANDSSRRGLDVVVVDSNSAVFSQLDDNFSGIARVADATDPNALLDAGILNAFEVIITTGNDNISLFLAHLCAKIYQVPYIYVRFDDPALGLLIQGMNIKAIYPFQLSRDRFNLLKTGVED